MTDSHTPEDGATLTEDEDREWTLEGFLADLDRVRQNPPPAPDGFDLIPCSAEHRHWPLYAAHVDGMYDPECVFCERDVLFMALERVKCERQHRRWKSWRIWGWINRRLYSLGAISGYGTSYGLCSFCGIGRQYRAPSWRGRRCYVLGVQREVWGCLMHGHRRSETSYGLCSICSPCPSCGSTDQCHPGDCGEQITRDGETDA